MENKQILYSKVIEVANDYLGPASKRFIDRQIINHLGKEPEEITYRDLDSLIDWIKVVVALLTEDKELINEFADRLRMLTKKTAV